MGTKDTKGMFRVICTQLNVHNVEIDLGFLADNIPLTINYNLKENKFTTLLEGELAENQLTQKLAGEIAETVYNQE